MTKAGQFWGGAGFFLIDGGYVNEDSHHGKQQGGSSKACRQNYVEYSSYPSQLHNWKEAEWPHLTHLLIHFFLVALFTMAWIYQQMNGYMVYTHTTEYYSAKEGWSHVIRETTESKVRHATSRKSDTGHIMYFHSYTESAMFFLMEIKVGTEVLVCGLSLTRCPACSICRHP